MENVMEPHQARLSVTWNGMQGDLPDPINFDAPDATIRQFATEAIRGGSIPGITADPNVDFSLFVVDRYPARDDRPWAIVSLRPKVPFGSK